MRFADKLQIEEPKSSISVVFASASALGAPRIHGELLKLGYDCRDDRRQVHGRRGPPSQSWRTFLRNHTTEIVAIDFLTVPTATFRILYVFVVLSLDRRRIVHFNVTDSRPSPPPFCRDASSARHRGKGHRLPIAVAERLRRAGDRIDPAGVPRPRDRVRRAASAAGAARVRRLLPRSRTHLGLGKDAPEPRAIQPRDAGAVVSEPVLGGLHHRYWRQAA